MTEVGLGIDFGAENIYVSWKEKGKPRYHSVQFEDAEGVERRSVPNAYLMRDEKKEPLVGYQALEQQRQGQLFVKYKANLLNEEGVPNGFAEEMKDPLSTQTLERVCKGVLDWVLSIALDQIIEDCSTDHDSLIVTGIGVTLPPVLESQYRLRKHLTQIIKQNELVKTYYSNARVMAISEPTAAHAFFHQRYNALFSGQSSYWMVIDIGASTSDISLCFDKSGEPLEILGSNSIEYAGNYFDKQVASNLSGQKKSVNDIQVNKVKYQKENFRNSTIGSLLSSCIAFFKQLLPARNREHHVEPVIAKMNENIASNAARICEKHGVVHLSHLIICGGMSKMRFEFFTGQEWSLIPTMNRLIEACNVEGNDYYDREKNRATQWHQSTGKNSNIGKMDSQLAVAHGAANIAMSPHILKETIGFDIAIVIQMIDNTKQVKARRINLIPHDHQLYIRKQVRLSEQVANAVNAEFGQNTSHRLRLDANNLDKITLLIGCPYTLNDYEFDVHLDASIPALNKGVTSAYVNNEHIRLRYEIDIIIEESGVLDIVVIEQSSGEIIATGNLSLTKIEKQLAGTGDSKHETAFIRSKQQRRPSFKHRKRSSKVS